MTFRLQFLTVILLALWGIPAVTASPLPVGWSDLPDPAMQVFDDPYRDLSPEQFDDVLFVVRLRNRLRKDVGTEEERQTWQELLLETEDALASDDIDVDWLLEQVPVVTERRERAGAAGNPQFDGQTVTLNGFAIPAPPEADGQAVAYLVPQFGMCSHMPPPPPNQMIRVQLDGTWTPDYAHVLVRVTGTLSIDPSEREIVVVDGLVPMRATFRLDVTEIEDLGGAGGASDAQLSLTDRIRAAGHKKTGGGQATE
ncbi:DUF3299 domain-containing protein [Ruegeria sp. EL01]|jgi:hypothetical protein|uniref:DUF3299 domain-containing protein n=1 Tax=Ruegeria sp. EL01 TaxID=2107578 RepID=UPI000EA82C14|nr:DUF3299 domain-containing protein [Ruegeria sp. EL01]